MLECEQRITVLLVGQMQLVGFESFFLSAFKNLIARIPFIELLILIFFEDLDFAYIFLNRCFSVVKVSLPKNVWYYLELCLYFEVVITLIQGYTLGLPPYSCDISSKRM